MAAKNKKNLLGTEDGQAIFEVLVFLPIFIFLYTVLYNVGNSINISINQQKATRRYFYYLLKGNSHFPTMTDLNEYQNSYTRVGMSVIGFKDRAEGGVNGSPVGPCLRFNSFLTGSSDETCVDATEGERATSFVRVFTAYGLCGDTYSSFNGHWRSMYEQGDGSPDPRSNPSNCSMSAE